MKRALPLVVVLPLLFLGCGLDLSSLVCSPSNCGGCCLENVCVTGDQPSACGVGGGACAACQAGDVCRTDGICTLDLEQQWMVIPYNAEVHETDSDGTPWDLDASPPDLYAVLTCPGSGESTQTAWIQSFSPTWEDGVCFTTAGALVSSLTPGRIRVFDSDNIVDDLVADASFTATEEELRLGGTALIDVGRALSVTVLFSPVPAE